MSEMGRSSRQEQITYPLAPMRGKRDWVASSTVSLKASEGEWPLARRTLYCARNMPSVRQVMHEHPIRKANYVRLTDTTHQLKESNQRKFGVQNACPKLTTPRSP